MNRINDLTKTINIIAVDWKVLSDVFDISAGGDVPKESFSDTKTQKYNIPILSNGIGKRSLYGWTDKAKITQPSLTISARGTIGWTSYRDTPFFPIVRLLVLTPKVEVNLKYAYYFMKKIENNYKVPPAGIPQLTKPMLRDVEIPIPCPDDPEKSLKIQSEIVRILDAFNARTESIINDISNELTVRKKQCSYYRDKLLNFNNNEVSWMFLGEAGELVRGNGLPKKDFTEEGVPAIHYGQVYTYYGMSTTSTLSFVSRETAKKLKKVNKGDVIITNTSENIDDVGKSLVYLGEEQAVTGGHATIFKPSSLVLGKYFAYYTQTREFADKKRKFAKGIKVIDVSANDLSKILIPVPTSEQQEYIVSVLDRLDVLKSSLNGRLLYEIKLRQKQYKYYHDLLFTFTKNKVEV